MGNARAWRPLIETISGLADQDGWVAEEPELHLLPHLEEAAAAAPLRIRSTRTDPDGAFLVELDWVGVAEPSRRAVRSALYGLIATLGETVTVVHEPPASRGRVLEVLTGSGNGGGPFAAHGHTLRLSVTIPGESRIAE